MQREKGGNIMMSADKISDPDLAEPLTSYDEGLDINYTIIEQKPRIKYQYYMEKLKPKKVVRKFFRHIRNNLK
jgi:hypothetical protein